MPTTDEKMCQNTKYLDKIKFSYKLNSNIFKATENKKINLTEVKEIAKRWIEKFEAGARPWVIFEEMRKKEGKASFRVALIELFINNNAVRPSAVIKENATDSNVLDMFKNITEVCENRYLNESLICDQVVNCLDESDEDPYLCSQSPTLSQPLPCCPDIPYNLQWTSRMC